MVNSNRLFGKVRRHPASLALGRTSPWQQYPYRPAPAPFFNPAAIFSPRRPALPDPRFLHGQPGSTRAGAEAAEKEVRTGPERRYHVGMSEQRRPDEQPPDRSFASTQWSLVLRAGRAGDDAARPALEAALVVNP